MARSVPIIDISPFRDGSDPQRVADAVDAACRTSGFLIVSGHGVAPNLVDQAVHILRGFFDQPTELKEAHAGEGRGYQPFVSASLGQSFGMPAPPDLRQGFTVKRTDTQAAASPVWAKSSDLTTAVSGYYAAMDALADVIMEIFARALGREEGYFRQFTDRHNSNLSFFHYPPMTRAPLPGQLRGGAHTDFGSVTLLYADPSVEGLQVQLDGVWEDVPVVPGTFVVNLGDLMQRWTNDAWRSTIHRVTNPAEGAWDRDRMSIAFFHQPNHDARITSLDAGAPAKYPAVTSGAHFEAKIKAMVVNG